MALQRVHECVHATANFENGDPTKWVIISAPLVQQRRGGRLLLAAGRDPNPPTGAHPIFSGAQHVWRSWAFGAGANPGAVPQDTTPEHRQSTRRTVLNSPRSAASRVAATSSRMGGDLTGTVYGTDRAGGAVSWIARNKADHGTLWATTSAGRVFVTHNADASDPATVVLAPDRQRDLTDEISELDLS